MSTRRPSPTRARATAGSIRLAWRMATNAPGSAAARVPRPTSGSALAPSRCSRCGATPSRAVAALSASAAVAAAASSPTRSRSRRRKIGAAFGRLLLVLPPPIQIDIGALVPQAHESKCSLSLSPQGDRRATRFDSRNPTHPRGVGGCCPGPLPATQVLCRGPGHDRELRDPDRTARCGMRGRRTLLRGWARGHDPGSQRRLLVGTELGKLGQPLRGDVP